MCHTCSWWSHWGLSLSQAKTTCWLKVVVFANRNMRPLADLNQVQFPLYHTYSEPAYRQRRSWISTVYLIFIAKTMLLWGSQYYGTLIFGDLTVHTAWQPRKNGVTWGDCASQHTDWFNWYRVVEIRRVLTVTEHFCGLSGYFVTLPQVLWLTEYNKMCSSYRWCYVGRHGSGRGLFIRCFPDIFLLGLRKITTCLSEGPICGRNLTDGYLVIPTKTWETQLLMSQKIFCISQHPKVHYYVQNSPSLVQTLSQINPLHALNPVGLQSAL
jgi:hypothetical protein